MRKTFNAPVLIGLLAAAAMVGVAGYETFYGEPLARKPLAPQLSEIPLVGGDGRPTTLGALRGSWTVIHFGYTTCPDVCPTTLAYLAKEMRELSDARSHVRVAFVSVDPQRDEPLALGRYVTHFDPSFVALTGTQDNLRAVTDAVGAYFKYEPRDDSAADYLVTHSTALFVLDPLGRFVKAMSSPHERGAVAKEMARLAGVGAH